MDSLRLALGLLTWLPVRAPSRADPDVQGRSLLWYPLVGLVIGALVTMVAATSLPTPVAAALGVIVWTGLTGGLHLDGLADCADAWVGAHGGAAQRDTTMRILNDPRCGVMAVVTIVLALLLRFSLISVAIDEGLLWFLSLAPVIARTQAMALFFFTPYVSVNGIGGSVAQNFPRNYVVLVFVATWLLTIFICPWQLSALTIVLCLVGFVVLRHMMLSRLQGFTGDCAGALIELTELAVLLCVVAALV